jgi:ribose/xylose/arabinose/galactoside ABC-type transport system permease subunit
VWVTGLLFAFAIVALTWHRQGRSLYAIGGNADAARAAGIRVDRVVWGVFILASVLAALAGILFVGRLGSIAATQGQGMIFQVFAAAVIGGISLHGGRGSMFGALTGVLVLNLINNVMNFAGVSPNWEQFLDGVIILAALVISRFSSGEAQD